jgi:hypothetical protein
MRLGQLAPPMRDSWRAWLQTSFHRLTKTPPPDSDLVEDEPPKVRPVSRPPHIGDFLKIHSAYAFDCLMM